MTWLDCPAFADVCVGGEAARGLQSAGDYALWSPRMSWERYQSLVELTAKARALFENDLREETGAAKEVPRILWEIEDLCAKAENRYALRGHVAGGCEPDPGS